MQNTKKVALIGECMLELHGTVFGNRLAARVIQHPGALIPVAALADLMAATSGAAPAPATAVSP